MIDWPQRESGVSSQPVHNQPSTNHPINIILMIAPHPGNFQAMTAARVTTATPTSCNHIPTVNGVTEASPIWKTSQGASPISARIITAIPKDITQSPAIKALHRIRKGRPFGRMLRTLRFSSPVANFKSSTLLFALIKPSEQDITASVTQVGIKERAKGRAPPTPFKSRSILLYNIFKQHPALKA